MINAETQRREDAEKANLEVKANRGRFGRRFFASAAAFVLVAVIFCACVRLWFVDGLLRRAVIDGPSMAPTFCGVHYEVRCGDCGFPFKCDAEHVPRDGFAACPNCGFTENKLSDARLMPADRVLIDRWPLLFRGPRRGEVVAFRASGNTEEMVIKRVVGLPGERISIVSSDLHVDDKEVRKSSEELKLWPHVYYLDPSGLARDWTAEKPLAPDEYFLLGDNQPMSIDSRHWGGVSRKAILGVVRRGFGR